MLSVGGARAPRSSSGCHNKANTSSPATIPHRSIRADRTARIPTRISPPPSGGPPCSPDIGRGNYGFARCGKAGSFVRQLFENCKAAPAANERPNWPDHLIGRRVFPLIVFPEYSRFPFYFNIDMPILVA
ncbi:hypothetical protein G6F65_017031 [Rhizopus arrhizus]|nr:hypothetical protein G6F65_017031 [Rhizopus arrhizus]